MISRRDFLVLSVLGTLIPALGVNLSGQSVPKAEGDAKVAPSTGTPVAIQVSGEVSSPLKLTREDLAKLPRQTVRAKGHDGVESQYQGVALIDILAKAGIPTGKDLRGKAMSLYIVVEAADGYRAVFALAELDPAFSDRVILLADRRDDRSLSTKEAPFQIIVPGEKKHARWVRQVTGFKVARG